MANKPKFWPRFGKFFSGLVVLCFFLPFFGVSCQGMDVITVSGADMVGGCKPGGLISEAANESKHHHSEGASADDDVGGVGGLDAHLDNVEREPLAIIALAVCLVAFGLSWVKTRQALQATFVVSLLGLGALVGLFVTVSREMSTMIDSETGSKIDHEGGGMMKKDDISSGPRLGLFVVAAGLIGTAILTMRALRKDDELTPLPAAPEPPAIT